MRQINLTNESEESARVVSSFESPRLRRCAIAGALPNYAVGCRKVPLLRIKFVRSVRLSEFFQPARARAGNL